MSADLYSTELTIQAAADLLNVSGPHVVRLLDEGKIPSHHVGQGRRILTKDAMAYKTQSDIDRRVAMAELAQLGQLIGIGYA